MLNTVSLAPHPDQALLTNLARAYERYAQQSGRWLEDYARDGGTVHCQAGCFHCCNLPIRVSLLEALLTVSGLSEVQLQAMWDRAFEVIANAGRASDWNDYVRSHRETVGFCPLLDQSSGTCTAYEVRPGRCRDTFSAMDSKFCKAGALERMNRRERAEYDRAVEANPVTDGVTHYIAPLEDLGEAIWEVAGRGMKSSWGLEIWGDFWVLSALAQDEAFMALVRSGQVRRARGRARALGLWHVEIVEIA